MTTQEKFLIYIVSENLFYDGTDPKVIEADIEGITDITDLGTTEVDEAKEFDTYSDANDFINQKMPIGKYQIWKVTVKSK